MIKNFLAVVVAVAFFTGSALADEITGFCSQVIDGNTLLVIAGGTQHTVKLGYIDAPEFDRKFRYEAKKCVEELALKQNIKLKDIEPGQGFVLAEVYSPKKQDPVNRLLVRAGLAWAKQGDDRYALAQSYAKKQSLGIWSDPGIQSPEEYRALKEQQLEAAKKKEEELRVGRMMDMIIKRSDYEVEIAKQHGYTAEPKEPAVAQQTGPIIETRPGYRAEDVEAEAQRVRDEQRAQEREEYCRQGFSSAHSGVGEYSRQQREMDFNEWAVKCGVDPPYKSPDVIIVDKASESRFVNKDPYNLGGKKPDAVWNKKDTGEPPPKPGKEYAKPTVEEIQK